MDYLTNSAEETQKIGEKFAQEISRGKTAVIICLKGKLGAGKTTFLQGLARGLKIKEKILSPTFVIMNRIGLRGGVCKNFYHFDCYRLEDSKEIIDLGFEEIISDKNNLVCIEWPEKIAKVLPTEVIEINFEVLEGDKRKIHPHLFKKDGGKKTKKKWKRKKEKIMFL
ncbi:MAG: tRNA (adenosine(37)-N6)-threonylcarbamoyltransferase complex ATPase subunit type 1 TsaE [Candidatus Paceibacterota bacterium]